MRVSGQSGARAYALLRALFGLALVGLAGLLAGCPSKAPGFLTVEVHATNTERCDDGIKVEAELDTSAFSRGPEKNWIWLKDGQIGGLMWMDDPYDNQVPGGPIKITAWCMRTGGQTPGKSVRVFNLDDYEAPWGVLSARFVIRDMSADPDTAAYAGYTEVVSPAPGIFTSQEWRRVRPQEGETGIE